MEKNNNTLLKTFVDYCQKHITGDEKGEAQIFLDHFFVALGYPEGLKGAGAECEFRIKNETKRTTSFGDLVWKKRVLIEMKKAKEDLSIHLQQVHSYWLHLASNRPQYVILCNFTEFWIYDFNKNIYEPQEKVLLKNIAQREAAFSFLQPSRKAPIFGHHYRDVTQDAADYISDIYRNLVAKKHNREDVLRFCLQCIISMFAEDAELLPDKLFTRLMQECYEQKQSTFDLLGGLFQQMNIAGITKDGRYKGVDYFKGGLFSKIEPFELNEHSVNLLYTIAKDNWRQVNPAVFGSIFEKSLETKERHKLGAHYTHEIDIKKIVDPVIVQPWLQKIDDAETANDCMQLLNELVTYKVLDPACGSGNFLFVAFKELKLIEKRLLSLLRAKSTKKEDAKKLQTR